MENTGGIYCAVTGKLLARRNAEGIYLWCKLCKTEHFVPWIAGENNEKNTDKIAPQAGLCYNLSR